MNKTATAVIVILVIIFGAWLLMRNNDKMNDDANDMQQVETGDMTTNPTPSSGDTSGVGVSTDVSVGTVKEFTVDASNFKFAPSMITVNKGDRVRITLKNTQGTHDLRLTGYELKTKMLNTGEQDSIEFVAATTGSFEYYCSMGNHRAMGMVGTLTVK